MQKNFPTRQQAEDYVYLFCFEHVDNLGAYSIPSGTGLLIPSDYINYAVAAF